MYIELTDIDKVKGQPLIRVVVSIWPTQAAFDAGQPPSLINDFLVQFQRTVTRIVTDGAGNYLRSDGVAVATNAVTRADREVGWQYETIDKTRSDLRQELRGHIRRYLRRAIDSGRAFGDRRDTRLALDNGEDDGTRAFILSWRGQREEVIP